MPKVAGRVATEEIMLEKDRNPSTSQLLHQADCLKFFSMKYISSIPRQTKRRSQDPFKNSW